MLGRMSIHSSKNSFMVFDLSSIIIVLNGPSIPHLHHVVLKKIKKRGIWEVHVTFWPQFFLKGASRKNLVIKSD